jgi:hypothetical protein
MGLSREHGGHQRVPPSGAHKPFGKSTADTGNASRSYAGKLSQRAGYSSPSSRRNRANKAAFNRPTRGGRH